MLRRNKVQIVISSIVLLLPMAAGFFFSGSKSHVMTALPLSILAAHWFFIFVTFRDSGNKHQNGTILKIAFWICPIISVFASGITIASALGHDFSTTALIYAPIALIYLVLGNYLPKCRQNHTIGIRIRWTLRDEENWNKTHRFTGKLWVSGALLLLFSVFLPEKISMPVFWGILLIVTFLPFLYSFLYYRKQQKAGKLSEEKPLLCAKEKRSNTLAAASVCVVLLLTGLLLVTGDIKIRFSDTAFTVESLYWEDTTISYSDIDEVEYYEHLDAGNRTFGFGSFRLQMGEFHNEKFGAYTRYTYLSCDPCIVVTLQEKKLVVNGKDEENTKEIYTMIQQKRMEQKGE